MREKKINLFTWDGYYTTFSRYKAAGFYSEAAWEKTEQDYRELTGGVSKYSTFDSFKVVMSRKNSKSENVTDKK